MQTWRRDKENPLRIGVGINNGELVLGTLGTKERSDYSIIGDTVNTGARLCSKAGPGEIIISPGVFKELTSEQQGKFAGTRSMHLKGKSESFDVHFQIVSSD